jgi:hypothetical protein
MTLFSWKQTLRELFKTTIIGGASFLLPVAIVIFILSYALRLVRRIAEPISHSLHLDHLVGAGVGTVTVLSVAALVLISFARRHHCPNGSRSAHYSLVGKLIPQSLPTLSSYKKYGRRPGTYRTYERIKAGVT